jgi:L-seryl-tRNA(Ser) seleniumtransferase
MTRDDLRHIPSVSELSRLLVQRGCFLTKAHALPAARTIQDAIRDTLLADGSALLEPELDRQVDRIARLFERSRYRRVINATGVIVHTNLGRAPVSGETARAMAGAAGAAVPLEIEPETGRRGGRMAEISELLRMLTGAEAVLVVNNNAAAVLLVLSALVAGRTVAVSRAEAVEIGGGFRIPDVLLQSGATLIEVGTTNRTYAEDFRRAGIGTGDAMLKVHSSNFRISGFVTQPALAELRAVADERDALLIEDLGSGTLVDTARFGIDHEPTVAESLAAGVDVVTFSGDKLLGGPQAGLIAGGADLVARIERHPLARAVRADKATLAGVAATLRHYLRGDADTAIPVLRMMGAQAPALRSRAEALARRLREHPMELDIVATTNFVGGGSLPGQALPGVALCLGAGHLGADEAARRIRLHAGAPVYGRIEDGQLLVELRTVDEADDEVLARTLIESISQ